MSESSAVIVTVPGGEDYTTWRELAALSTDAGELSIRVSEDGLEALLFGVKGPGEASFTPAQVIKLLQENKVNLGIKENAIEDAINVLVAPGDRVQAELIAKGISPTHGKDGEIEYLFDRTNPRVSRGAELIKISEPTSGENGQDIFGAPIACAKGREMKVTLVEGVEEDEGKYFAEDDGFAVVGYQRLAVSPDFDLRISEDGYEAELSFSKSGVSKAEIVNYLKSVGVDKGFQKDAIDRAAESGSASQVVIAEGTKPVAGTDAQLEYSYERRDGGALKQDASGRVDYKNQSTFVMVDEGQQLLRLVPAQLGRTGVNVFGVVDEVGEAKEIKIIAGENVITQEDEGATLYMAGLRGTPLLKGGTISVSNVYAVSGDVDLSVGNITFEGSVRIGGHVLDGFEVHSDRDLFINGTVGAAKLHAGGNMEINSGFKGKRQAEIFCGGDLSAKYIDDMLRVEVEGDVIAEREIVGCNLSTRGKIESAAGVLVGGETVCLGGIHVGTLGSDAYVRTTVLVGEDYQLLRYREEWDPKLLKMGEEEKDIAEKLAAIKRNPVVLKRMSPDLKKKFKNMLLRLKEIQQLREEVGKRLGELQAEGLSKRNTEIRVEKMLYPGTFIKMGFSEQEIKSELAGPLLISEDVENQMIAINQG